MTRRAAAMLVVSSWVDGGCRVSIREHCTRAYQRYRLIWTEQPNANARRRRHIPGGLVCLPPLPLNYSLKRTRTHVCGRGGGVEPPHPLLRYKILDTPMRTGNYIVRYYVNSRAASLAVPSRRADVSTSGLVFKAATSSVVLGQAV
uniref:Uncharacterized protein n=1 Tax=Rhipicephalus zambeziensis TaxID=60191 RepID=A0A224Y6K7_9ACAR